MPFNGDAREFVVTSLKRINQVAVVVDDDNTEVTATTISSTQQQWALDKELELIAVQYEKKRRIMKGIKEEAPPITTRALVTPFRMFDHYIMNLPDSSISFLDCFIGLLAPYRHLIAEGGEGLKKLPIVHCHCFSRALDNLEMDVIKVRVREM